MKISPLHTTIFYRCIYICIFLLASSVVVKLTIRADSRATLKVPYQKRVVLDGKSSNYVLRQDMLVSENTIYLIQDNFDLKGGNLDIPDNCLLVFEGGSLSNGSITGSHSCINNVYSSSIIFDGISIKGSWYVSEISDCWFSFNSNAENHNELLNSIFALTNDNHYNTVTLSPDREYKLQDVYNGRVDLGTMVRPNYSILQSDAQRPNHEILHLKSNTKLVLNGKIQLNPTKNGIYFMLSIVDKENVEICGNGGIYGDVRHHLYIEPFVKESKYYGEWGHCITIRNSKNITIKGITVAEAFGDGINVSCHVKKIERNPQDPTYMPSKGVVDGPCKFVVFDNLKILHCRRNGIAGAAHNWSIKNCHFEGNGLSEIKGTAPQAAIDFENDYIKIAPHTCNQNTVMLNCTFKNNVHDVSSTNNSPKNYKGFATRILNCNFTAPLRLNVTHNILFESCVIPRITNVKDSSFYFVNSHNLVIKDCMVDVLHPFFQTTSESHGYKFVNCIIGQQ